MNIERLTCAHFRNYESMSFSFEPNCIHFLCGKNAQGKTNLMEAIFFLSYLRSFRTNQVQNLVMHEHSDCMISARIESNHRKEDLKIVIQDQKKHLFRFSDPIKKYSDFVGIVNAILFCPDDLMLFTQSPKQRRRFIDMELIKISKTYTSTLSMYQKLLKERNIALKQDKVDEFLVDIYLDQMIDAQKIIITQRSHFIQRLMDEARKIYPFFSKEKEELGALYETFVDVDDQLEDHLRLAYEKVKKKEILYRQTLIGIHKDDICFLLNGKPVQEVASQGQKRSFVLALKLALAKIIYDKTHQYPILLLDDVFSELDDDRKVQFIHALPRDMQIFITTTDRLSNQWNRPVHYYEIEQGTIREVNV